MSERAIRATGGCLCGGVRFEVHGPLRDVMICHCSQCRRTSGHVAAFSSAAREDLVFTSDTTLKWYRSSEQARRGFCEDCGASLFWEPAGEARIGVAAGALDLPTGLKTVRHVFVADAADYYEIADGLSQDVGSHFRT